MPKIILAGNALTAEILYGYLRRDPRYEVLGLTVDAEYLDQGRLPGLRAVELPRAPEVFPPESCRVVMAIGYRDLNRVRASVFERLKSLGYTMETYIHPDARVYSEIAPGEGSVVLGGAVIEPHARVGADTVVWSNVTLAHHSCVADHCWIAAGTVVSGNARVERHCFLGVNATVVNGVTVAEHTLVGAAAMISRDTRPHSVHLARSAEPLRYSAEDYIKYFGV